MTKKNWIDTSSLIDGWLYPNEQSELYELAKSSIGPIVEIGTWFGKSAVCIVGGNLAGNNHQFTAIDPCLSQRNDYDKPVDISQSVIESLKAAGIYDSMTLIRSHSVSEAQRYTGRIGFIFIDALHEYEHIKADVHSWSPKIMVGGILAAHDYGQGFDGVKKFFDTDPVILSDYTLLRVVDTTAVFRKNK